MEEFIKHIRQTFFVDYDDAEVKSISTAVHKYLCGLIDLINEQWEHGRYMYKVVRIERCGSMEETTRVWEVDKDVGTCPEPVLEYDYLAVVEPVYKTYTVRTSHPGYLKIYMPSTESWLSYIWGKPLSAKIFNEQFLKTICTMKTSCQCFKTNFHLNLHGFLTRKKEEKCSCLVCSSNRLHLQKITQKDFTFRWECEQDRSVSFIDLEGKFRQSTSRIIRIKLDFLPVLELKNGNVHQCFLIPKFCSTSHENCWRISYCKNEMQMLKNTSQCHRDVYKIIKSLIQVTDWAYVPSYDIKNVVLSHIQECKNGEGHIIQCLCQILSEYGNYVDKGTIPHFEINGLKLQRKYESRAILKAFGQFLVLLSRILGQTSEKPCCGYHELKLPKMETILWTKELRPELFMASLDFVLGDAKCIRFHEELSKVFTNFENYNDMLKEQYGDKIIWKKRTRATRAITKPPKRTTRKPFVFSIFVFTLTFCSFIFIPHMNWFQVFSEIAISN